MRLFALETDWAKVKSRFLAEGEREVFTVTPHAMLFLVRIAWDVMLTLGLGALAFYAYSAQIVTFAQALLFFWSAWCVFVLFSVLKAFIDWKFDVLLLTTDKLILVDQVSLFRKLITPIALENLGDIVAETQWLNLFGFGIIRLKVKEGNGPDIVLKFMPDADALVGKISEQITLYQRRKDVAAFRSRPDDAS